MKHLISSASLLAIAGLSACGQQAEPQQAAGEAAPVPVTASARPDAGPGPQVGDRIPEPAPITEPVDGTSSRFAEAGAEANEIASRGIVEIGWEELMPAGEDERIAEMYQAQMASLYSGVAEGSPGDQAVQVGTFNTVDEINGVPADGLKIRLPGYTVPFQYGSGAEIDEFLLVPYYGACLHAPPPPPNQTVFVRTDEPIRLRDLSQAVWIEGVLRIKTQTSDLADAAYTIEMTSWEKYEY